MSSGPKSGSGQEKDESRPLLVMNGYQSRENVTLWVEMNFEGRYTAMKYEGKFEY